MRWLVKLARAILNRYEGAQYSGRRAYVYQEVQSARWDIDLPQRRELVRLARHAEANNALMQRMADLWEQHTVGQGLVVQPASSDQAWNTAAAEWWNEWAMLPDLSSRQELPTLLSMIARAWFVDGESFVLLTNGESRPRLQVIETHLIQTPPGKEDDFNCLDGIDCDGNLRPIRYWVTEEKAKGRTVYTPHDADKVLHVFEPSRAGQTRGLPFIHAVINDMRDLDLLQTLEMDAAKAASRVTNVRISNDGLDPQSYRASRVTRSTTLSTAATATETRVKHYDDVTGARELSLKIGEDFKQFQSTRPSVATRDYWRFLMEKICIGCGFPYVLVFPDSMQGTVYRGALDMAASFFRLRSLVMQAAVRRIWGYVMAYARNAYPPLRDAPADWRRIRISPPRAVNVDVGYNAEALVKGLASLTTNWGDHFSALGQDWREQVDAYAEQLAYIKAKGIEPQLGQKPEQPEEEEKEEVSNGVA